MRKQFTEKEEEQAFQAAPAAVQEFVSSGVESGLVISAIGKEHQFHIDTIGALAELNRYMLLGLISPKDFSDTLLSMDIDPVTVQQILGELNEKIFSPIQKQLRGSSKKEQSHAAANDEQTRIPESMPPVPVMQIGNKMEVLNNLPGQKVRSTPPPAPAAVPAAAPIQAPAPVAPPAPAFSVPVQTFTPSVNQLERMATNPVQAPAVFMSSAPVPPPVPAPAPVYQAPAPMSAPIYSNQAPQPIAPAPVSTEAYRPAARTMESDIERLSQGYQAIASGQPFQVPAAPVFIQPQAVPAPAPVYAPPVPMPPPLPEPSVSSYPPPAMASVRLTPVDRTHASSPITKEFGSDPYREPIE